MSGIPVTVLCGGLGAGKTTVLNHVLTADHGREVAVVVNDVGEVNVDADLVESRTDLADGDLVALENGCICCSLGGDLSRSMIRLQRERAFDALVIEASGVGEPEPIARQFTRGPAGGVYDLDSVTTVVDARAFHDAVLEGDPDSVPTRSGPDETGTRPLADLWLEQVEYCDRLVVNKCDLVTETERERVLAALDALQPAAEVVTTVHGRLDPGTLLETGRFDPERVRDGAGWKRAVEAGTGGDEHEHRHADGDIDDHGHGDHDSHDHGAHDHADHDSHDHVDHDSHDHTDHVHPPERYGIAVESYRRVRPLHPERFAALLRELPDGLVRAKGLCWVAGRERQAITLHVAPGTAALEVTGRWLASLPAEQRERYGGGSTDDWHEKWGDRETRLALIGRDLSFDALIDRLDDCLLTDAELDAAPPDWTNPAPTAMGERVVLAADDRADTAGEAISPSSEGRES